MGYTLELEWAGFAYLVIPAGAALTLMLLSGLQFLVEGANFILTSPIRVGRARVSVALLMTGFCAAAVLLSYSGLRRAEQMLQEGRMHYQGYLVDDQFLRNVFRQGRKFWMAMMGLAMWAIAWRLNALFDSRSLTFSSGRQKSVSRTSRLKYAAIALLCAALADLPLCRLNYALQITTFITPKKQSLLAFSRRNHCENAFLETAQGDCAQLCADARALSADRLWAVRWARDWHVFGRLAAQAFDEFRNVRQGEARIQGLFERRPCARVLASVDRTSTLVNAACAAFAGVSILGFLVAIQHLLDGSDEESSSAPAPDGNAVELIPDPRQAHTMPEPAKTRAHAMPEPAEAD